MARRILVTGASIAGNIAAWQLGRCGLEVTVVERALAFRGGGQNVDVRGVGREVLRRTGLERAALDRGTGEQGTVWVDGRGQIAARLVTAELGQDGPTAEMEVLRGDLARLLHEPARQHASFRFGEEVRRIEQDADATRVTFASGDTERFDAVIVAEGVGSSTRELVFPGENEPRWMNLTVAYFTIPRACDDDLMWRWFSAPGGLSVSLRPDRHGTTRAMLMLQQPPGNEQAWDVGRQKAYLRDRFSNVGWQAPRVLDALAETDDFYFDVLRQVRMKRWWKGRVVLTGDAAWCATPLAGMGTTLAITGAYVLAAELAQSEDVASAFCAYEKAMRPMVDGVQGVPKLLPRLMHPRSRRGIRILHGALRMANRPRLRGLVGRMFDRRPVEPDLSRYANGQPAALRDAKTS